MRGERSSPFQFRFSVGPYFIVRTRRYRAFGVTMRPRWKVVRVRKSVAVREEGQTDSQPSQPKDEWIEWFACPDCGNAIPDEVGTQECACGFRIDVVSPDQP